MMAQPMICGTCEEEPAAVILTLTEDGTTLMVGQSCLPATAVGMVEALCGVSLVPADGQASAAGASEPLGEPDTPSVAEEVPKSRARRDRAPAGDPAEASESP